MHGCIQPPRQPLPQGAHGQQWVGPEVSDGPDIVTPEGIGLVIGAWKDSGGGGCQCLWAGGFRGWEGGAYPASWRPDHPCRGQVLGQVPGWAWGALRSVPVLAPVSAPGSWLLGSFCLQGMRGGWGGGGDGGPTGEVGWGGDALTIERLDASDVISVQAEAGPVAGVDRGHEGTRVAGMTQAQCMAYLMGGHKA